MNRPDEAEGEAAIAAGNKLSEILRPLNGTQRAWAVALVLAEFSSDDPGFCARVGYLLARATSAFGTMP